MTTDTFDAHRVAALAALLDRPAPVAGEALPLLWHLIFHLPRPATADLGPDGHPTVGLPAPPGPGMRRMFAGGRVRLTPGPRVGDIATATTEVVAEKEREGRSGPMRFVTTRTTHLVERTEVLSDERDIVYLPGSPTGSTGPTGSASEPVDTSTRVPVAVAAAAASRSVAVDPRLLFRFSALTYNAHRIHYDLSWTRGVEGYDGLVVHGPLQALLMAEVGSGLLSPPPGAAVSVSYRLVAPLLEHQGMHVVADPDESGGVGVRVLDGTGRETARSELAVLTDPADPAGV